MNNPLTVTKVRIFFEITKSITQKNSPDSHEPGEVRLILTSKFLLTIHTSR